MVRSDAEVVSRLPVFETKASTDFPGWLVVTCPHEDCGDIFLVRKSHWMEKKDRTTHQGKTFTIKGRPCPYCFRAGKLPTTGRGRVQVG